MPAVGKVTLDIRDYEAMLKRMQKSTASAAAASSRSFQRVGGDLNKGTETAQKMASAFGGALAPVSKLGGAVMALASGPVAALSAGIALLATVGVKVWDKLTLSAEEYRDKQQRIIDESSREISRLRNSASVDNEYLSTLQRIAESGDLTADKMKLANDLIGMLQSSYKGLGLSIDDVIRNTNRLSDAQKEMANQQIEREIAQQKRISAAASAKGVSLARGALSSWNSLFTANVSDLGEEKFAKLFGENGRKFMRSKESKQYKGVYDESALREYVADRVVNGTNEDRVRILSGLRDESNSSEDIAKFSASIDEFVKAIDADISASRMETSKEISKANADMAKTETSSSGDMVEKGAVKTEELRAYQTKLMQKLGMGEDAAVANALAKYRADAEKRGDVTTLEGEQQVERFARDNYRLDNMPNVRYDEIKTNSLTARGGFAGGAAIVNKDNINKDILKQTEKMVAALEDVSSKLTDSEAD